MLPLGIRKVVRRVVSEIVQEEGQCSYGRTWASLLSEMCVSVCFAG